MTIPCLESSTGTRGSPETLQKLPTLELLRLLRKGDSVAGRLKLDVVTGSIPPGLVRYGLV